MKRSHLFFFGSIALFAIVFAVGVMVQPKNSPLNGSLIQPTSSADDFQLTDQNGNAYRLSAQQGKLVLLFFGYTHCPDVCPMTLAQFRNIKASLKEQAKNVEFVFVTVDPAQDSLSRMKEYVDAFDPQFIGLTGTQLELEQVWKDYGVYQEKKADGASNNSVDHSARIYLIDRQGKLLLTYPSGFETDQIVQDIRSLLVSSRS